MSLSPTHNSVRVSNVLPDAIRLNFQYRLPVLSATVDSVCRRLQQRGFTRARNRPSCRGNVVLRGSRGQIGIYATYNQSLRLLSLYADINILRHVRSRTRLNQNERGLNGEINWLPLGTVRRNNRHIWRATDTLIEAIRVELEELVRSMIDSLGGFSPPSYRHISIAKLEVAVDMPSASPVISVTGARIAFQQSFKSVRVHRYRAPAELCEIINGEVLMLSAFRRAGERYKLYPKTNRRIRLECQLDPAAFTRLGVSRSIDEENSFSQVFENVARHCVTHFNTFLSRARLQSDEVPQGSAIEYIARIGAVIHSPGRVQELVRLLAVTGRVTSSFGRQQLANLANCGLLDRVDRGIYVCAPEWMAAIHSISQIDAALLGNLLRGVVR